MEKALLAPGCVPTNISLFLKVKGWDRNLRACQGNKCREQMRKSQFQKMEEGMLVLEFLGATGQRAQGWQEARRGHTHPKMGRGRRLGTKRLGRMGSEVWANSIQKD